MGHLETSPQETDGPSPYLLDLNPFTSTSIQWSSYLYREGPTGDCDHWAAVEVVGEFVAVHCGAHEDEP